MHLTALWTLVQLLQTAMPMVLWVVRFEAASGAKLVSVMDQVMPSFVWCLTSAELCFDRA